MNHPVELGTAMVSSTASLMVFDNCCMLFEVCVIYVTFLQLAQR
jgi:hypothetical protein